MTHAPTPDELARRIRVARGDERADRVLANARVVNVFTRRVEPANLALCGGFVAGVGPHDWYADDVLDLDGRFVLPGLIDAHMHLESTLLTPAELARTVVPHGTTATISDSHEIGNVLGVPGIDLLIAASEGLPLDLFLMASSCVPCTKSENAGAVLGPAEVRNLLGRRRVLGLAEVMDVPAVLAGDGDTMAKLCHTLATGRALDGHAPAMTGRDLVAYAAAGIRSDHESSTLDEARAKAALGMLVQVREGSAARNLDTLLPAIVAGELGDNWCLVTDDVFPDELKRVGHLDGLLRRVVAGGVDPAEAVRHASFVPARHYGLADRGAAAPGYRADLVVVDDLKNFRVRLVLKDGRVVARDGQYTAGGGRPALEAKNTVNVGPLDASAFRVRVTTPLMPAVGVVPDQIVTAARTVPVHSENGLWAFDPGMDVAMLASIERHRATGRVGVGLVAGLGFRRHGALASSVAHDSHNLVVAGTNARDMLACVEVLKETGGGFVAAADGMVIAGLPLPVAGLLSLADADTVCRQLAEVNAAARSLGCPLSAPFGTLSFLALPVIPELRITDGGLFDVVNQRFLAAG